jgi:hypothetical protein
MLCNYEQTKKLDLPKRSIQCGQLMASCAPYITMAILFSVVLNGEIEWFRVLKFDSKQYNLSSTEIPVSTIRVGWKTGS